MDTSYIHIGILYAEMAYHSNSVQELIYKLDSLVSELHHLSPNHSYLIGHPVLNWN